jgi:hypothetical protein
MKILQFLGSLLTLAGFAWLLAHALTQTPQNRPYIPKQRQEEKDKWDDEMNFV